MTPEGRIKELVKVRIRRFWPTSYRFAPVQNGMGSPSLDVLYCICGLFIGIETKQKGKKPTPRQEQTIESIRLSGGLAFVVDDEESLCEAIKTIQKAIRCRS